MGVQPRGVLSRRVLLRCSSLRLRRDFRAGDVEGSGRALRLARRLEVGGRRSSLVEGWLLLVI